jgi:hypothetical protein
MSSSLFLKPVDPHSFFEKQASIAKMPDDDTKWPAQVLSSLHQQLPFLSQYEIDLDMQRIEPEAGFAFGHALLMAKNDPTAATASKNPQNMVRIPIIVADRLLQPFHTFELSGNVYPLTAERIESALLNPSMFQGPADQPQRQKSLIDQMYPPYQQRQGFGRVVGDGASSMGINKLSSAPEVESQSAFEMPVERLERITKLRRSEAKDRYLEGEGFKGRTKENLKGSLLPVSMGLAFGAGRGVQGRAAGTGILEAAKAGMKRSAPTSAIISGTGMTVKEVGLQRRQAERERLGMGRAVPGALPTKEAALTLSFGMGNRVPASVVLKDAKVKISSGVDPSSLRFYEITGSPYTIGIPSNVADKLEKTKDQSEIRRILAPLMKTESQAQKAGHHAQGMFLLFHKSGGKYRSVSAGM